MLSTSFSRASALALTKPLYRLKASGLGHAIRKKRSDLAPVCAAGDPAGAVESVGSQHPRTSDMRRIQLVFEEGRCQTFIRSDAIERDSRRRLEAGGAAMAHLLASLHVPMNFVLRYPEVVLENAAYPKGGRLLI